MRPHHAFIALLLVVAGSLAAVKVLGLGYQLDDVLPRTQYRVTIEMRLDGHDDAVNVRTFLPVSDRHQQVTHEVNTSPDMHFDSELDGVNRVGRWSGARVPDATELTYAFDVLGSRVEYDIDPTLAVPGIVPPSVAPFLRPEEGVQVDDPAIEEHLRAIGADHGTVLERLRRIHEATASLRTRPFKGPTDALTALRLGEASCNGKSRLFVALARAAGLPARLVGGLVLDPGRKPTSHQWVEVYIGGHWVPFCPTNGAFAELPAHYLVLYRGDAFLFKHTADINFDHMFDIAARAVPSPKALAAFGPLNVWALFQRLGLPWSLLRTLLMLPVGALVVVVFRNVVGLKTFGTFLPALMAAAASSTGLLWGIAGLGIVTVAVVAMRLLVERLRLLHSPTLAILLATVTTTLLVTSLAAERVGVADLAHVALFPIAVLAITAERFYLAWSERGPRAASEEMAGTVVVIAACYAVMGSLALQALVLGFPEVILVVVAADVYLGRWVGVRLLEYVRFRHLLLERA